MACRTINYIIDYETDLARFEFYLKEHLNIQSITLQSITFYNSWFLEPDIYIYLFKTYLETIEETIPLDKDRWCTNQFTPLLGMDKSSLQDYARELCDEYMASDSKKVTEKYTSNYYSLPYSRHFSLPEFCTYWQNFIDKVAMLGFITIKTIISLSN